MTQAITISDQRQMMAPEQVELVKRTIARGATDDYYSPVEERAEKDVLTRIKEMAFEDPSQPIINVLYLIHTHEESAQRTD